MQGLTQMVPGTRCAGRAVTVREITGRRGDFTSEDFKVGHMIDAAGPGDILVIDNGGHCVSTFGGLATLAAKAKGIGGLVADGGVRDREEMIEHEFPVFARHMTPLTGRTRLAITDINEPVACGGVRVRPGDVIVADGSGVVCIPAEHAAKVAELARRYAKDDEQAAAELVQGPLVPRGDGQVPAHLTRAASEMTGVRDGGTSGAPAFWLRSSSSRSS